MARKVMPGTPKQRSVGRPAQGRGRRAGVQPNTPRNQLPLLAAPRGLAAKARASSAMDKS